jgi:hypothetical protein
MWASRPAKPASGGVFVRVQEGVDFVSTIVYTSMLVDESSSGSVLRTLGRACLV